MLHKQLHAQIAFLLTCVSLASLAQEQANAQPPLFKGNQRVVIAMVDGLGPDYVEQSPMPVLKGLMAKGFTKTVAGVMPSVTNVDNASIATGTWPEEHGMTGNSFSTSPRGRRNTWRTPTTCFALPSSNAPPSAEQSRLC